MPTEYFEQRERALLGRRYEQLYAAPQQTAERGVTVSALRTTPEQFASFVRAELAKYEKVVKATGAKAD